MTSILATAHSDNPGLTGAPPAAPPALPPAAPPALPPGAPPVQIVPGAPPAAAATVLPGIPPAQIVPGAPPATTVPPAPGDQDTSVEAYRKLQGANDILRDQAAKTQKTLDDYRTSVAPAEKMFEGLASRPDLIPVIQQAVRDHESGLAAQNGFDPAVDWVPEEAYVKGSKSYAYREAQENARIQTAVGTAVAGVREERQTDQALTQLVRGGMPVEVSQNYLKFLESPEQFPGGQEFLMGPAARAFHQFQAGTAEAPPVTGEAPLQAPQNYPSAGALSGAIEAPRDEVDQMMDNIVAGAAGRSILAPNAP